MPEGVCCVCRSRVSRYRPGHLTSISMFPRRFLPYWAPSIRKAIKRNQARSRAVKRRPGQSAVDSASGPSVKGRTEDGLHATQRSIACDTMLPPRYSQFTARSQRFPVPCAPRTSLGSCTRMTHGVIYTDVRTSARRVLVSTQRRTQEEDIRLKQGGEGYRGAVAGDMEMDCMLYALP